MSRNNVDRSAGSSRGCLATLLAYIANICDLSPLFACRISVVYSGSNNNYELLITMFERMLL